MNITYPYNSKKGPANEGFNQGFTLIELTIVLVIIGMLVGMGVSMMGPLIKRAKLTETRETVKAVKEAVVGYAVSQKRLPSTLAVLGVKTTDSYAKDIFYLPSNNLTTSDLCTSSPQSLIVNDKGTQKARVVFVVLSSGENVNNDTGTASPFNILETGAAVGSTGRQYDDIVEYVEIDSLREKACNPIKITTDNLPAGIEEVGYTTVTLSATDGTLPYVWSITGSLPPGITLSGNQISGTPTRAGTYNFTIGLRDAEGRQSNKSLTIVINPNPPRITTEFLAYGTVNKAYPSTTLGATGGKPSYTWTRVSGNMPTGLSLNSIGTITGTSTAAGTYSFVVRVTDSGSPQRVSQDKTLSITINPESGGGDGNKDSKAKLTILNTDYENSDYKINDGACQIWKKGESLTLGEGEKISLYWQGGGAYAGKCASGICTKTYGELKSLDKNGDNTIKLISSFNCSFGDAGTGGNSIPSIIATNTTGNARWYKLDNGSYTTWNNNADMILLKGQKVLISIDNQGNYICAASDYNELKTVFDKNNNGFIKMSGLCAFSDK